MNLSSINGLANTSQAQTITGKSAQNTRASGADKPTPAAETKQDKKPESTRAELDDAIKQVNDFLKPINTSIQFNLDDDSGQTVVKVVDMTTKDIIRQFPSEEMIAIAKAVDKMKGLLIQQKA